MAQFRGIQGSKRGQKDQNVAIPRKKGQYELKICNYSLNHIGELIVTQLLHKLNPLRFKHDLMDDCKFPAHNIHFF